MYEPTENDIRTATEWLRHSDPEIMEGIDAMGYYPFEYPEVIEVMNKYAVWNLQEFCKDLQSNIREWESSPEVIEGGVSIEEMFEFHIIRRFK